MPESVQSCFKLSVHLSVSKPAVNCSKNSSQEKNTGKCVESSKHDWTLSCTATSLKFFFLISFSYYQKFPIHEFFRSDVS